MLNKTKVEILKEAKMIRENFGTIVELLDGLIEKTEDPKSSEKDVEKEALYVVHKISSLAVLFNDD